MTAFAADVRDRRFPADDESYHLPEQVAAAMGVAGGATKTA
jgi:hypothetical protein